jgi:hypothetical protein
MARGHRVHEPVDVGRLEVRNVDAIANGIAAGSRVLRVPGTVEPARDGLHLRLDDVGIGADRTEVRFELRLRGAGSSLLPCVKCHRLLQANRIAELVVGQTARKPLVGKRASDFHGISHGPDLCVDRPRAALARSLNRLDGGPQPDVQPGPRLPDSRSRSSRFGAASGSVSAEAQPGDRPAEARRRASGEWLRPRVGTVARSHPHERP